MGLFGFGYSKEKFDKAQTELDQLVEEGEQVRSESTDKVSRVTSEHPDPFSSGAYEHVKERTDAEKEAAFQKEFTAEMKVDSLREQAHKEALKINKRLDEENKKKSGREFNQNLSAEPIDKEF